jgi:hypothetical protein
MWGRFTMGVQVVAALASSLWVVACSGDSNDGFVAPHRGKPYSSSDPSGDDASTVSTIPSSPDADTSPNPGSPAMDDAAAPPADSGPTGPAGTDSSVAAPVTFSGQVQTIFTSNCSSCHHAGGQSPNLSAGSAYAAIVNVTAGNCAAADYVVPGQPGQSYLVAMITVGASIGACSGGAMSVHIGAAKAATITTWVQQGALNN